MKQERCHSCNLLSRREVTGSAARLCKIHRQIADSVQPSRRRSMLARMKPTPRPLHPRTAGSGGMREPHPCNGYCATNFRHRTTSPDAARVASAGDRRASRRSPSELLAAIILTAFRKLNGLAQVELEDPLSVMDALERYEAGMNFADALHLASARGAETFATFDARLMKRAGDGVRLL